MILGMFAALVAAAFVLPGCSQKPQTPEALMAEVSELLAADDPKAVWALLDAEAQQHWRTHIDERREMVRKNPHPSNQKFLDRWDITLAQFNSLPYIELFVIESKAWTKGLVGYEISDVRPDPKNPDHTLVTWTSVGYDTAQRARLVQQSDGSFALFTLRDWNQ